MSLHSSSDQPSVSWTVNRSGSFTVELAKTLANDAIPVWGGETNANGISVQDSLVVHQGGMEAFSITANSRPPDLSKKNAVATLIIDPANKIYRVDFGLGYFVTVTLNGFSQNTACANPPVLPALRPFPLPETGLVLSGSLSYPAGDACNLKTFDCNDCILGYAAIGGATTIPGTVDITWTLKPKQPMELVIEPQGYSSWRPEAARDEDTPANSIPIKVTLKTADGSPPAVKAEKLVFELIDTSREPGVAMNFPLKASAKNTFDLQFRKANNPSTLTVANNGQTAETIAGEYTTYTVTLSSFDWGGWTKLRATAVMPNGDEIVGHLVSDPSVEDVPIPKRKDDSHIAEAWLNDSGASGEDGDDDENEPVGDGNKGDGLTLYEEYRGFHEKGRHIEANPKKKDYFLLNLVGADAELGVGLFANLSDLKVHKDLQRDELADDRLINANTDQGAHSVDQHGVILKTGKSEGAGGTGDLPPGPPKNTPLVLIEPRDERWGEFATDRGSIYRLSHADAMKAYDRAVAHELLHTVGVWHHGEGDYRMVWRWHHSSVSLDGKPYFVSLQTYDNGHLVPGGTETRIHVTVEESGRDYAQVMEERMAVALAVNPGAFPGRTVLIDPASVGKAGGQHSGADDCVMRYYFATFYEVKGRRNEFYTFENQKIGLVLDDSPEGTGNNASGHKPQPRFFDASVGRGDRHQIVVNDKANPVRP